MQSDSLQQVLSQVSGEVKRLGRLLADRPEVPDLPGANALVQLDQVRGKLVKIACLLEDDADSGDGEDEVPR